MNMSGKPEALVNIATRKPRPSPAAAAPEAQRLRISVVNGNLKFIAQPLLLGHYSSLALTGSEKTVDVLLGGTMSRSLQTGLYPSAVGSQQVFMNRCGNPGDPFKLPRPKAVVVAGLGDEGSLRSRELSDTVRQALIAYAQRAAEDGNAGAGFEIGATLIGSGGAGIDVGLAARSVARGVQQANGRLAAHRWPVVSHLHIIELFLDRATEAHQALSLLSRAHPEEFDLETRIVIGTGPLRRPPGFGYRGARYDFIGIEHRSDEHGQPVLDFTLATQRARNEVRAQGTQSRLIDDLIQAGADARARDPHIGRTLFNLLVPVELEPFLSGSDAVVLQLDDETARVPWEMLDTNPEGKDSTREPWAVRTRMVRQLRVREYRDRPTMARSDHCVLVIGEPKSDMVPLSAATIEAKAVADALGDKPLLGADPLKLINALMERPYRIVHIAGHGQLPDASNPLTGVVLANGRVLGPREFKSMRTVPELAFINCCHLGSDGDGTNAGANPLGSRQPLFAASVARQLIEIGVRCVIAAGWAVEDKAACEFAVVFYRALLQGARFLDAVGAARKAAWKTNPNGNTWAAYQCYGDPDWRYDPAAQPVAGGVARDGAIARSEIVSAVGLMTEIDAIAVSARYDDCDRGSLIAELQQIEKAAYPAWKLQGAVAEALATAYDACGAPGEAIRLYRSAVVAGDGGASMKAREQLCNLQVREAERLADADADAARRHIRAAIAELDQLNRLSPSSERWSLIGSSWKRLAMVEARVSEWGKRLDAVQHMAYAYMQAEQLAQNENGDNLFYPRMNRMAAELAVRAGEPGWSGFVDADVQSVRESLATKIASDPDFWSYVGAIELELYDAAAKGALHKCWPSLQERLKEAQVRAPDVRKWDSVFAQARFIFESQGRSHPLADAEARIVRELLAILESYAAPKVAGGA